MFWQWLLRYSSFLVTGAVSLLVGLLLDRWTRHRANLIYYFTHPQIVRINPPIPPGAVVQAGAQPVQNEIGTLTLFLWNQGKAPAKEVHVGHTFLPAAYSVYPDIPAEQNPLPGGGVALRFPIFPARTLVTITYLLAGPFAVGQVIQQLFQYIGSQDGAGTHIPVMLQRIWPKWLIASSQVLVFAGIWVAVNAVWSIIRFLWIVYYR